MNNGKYNRLVTIQQLAAGQDALGQPVQTWSDVCSPWAWMVNQSGASAIKASADVSTLQTSIRIKWRATTITAGTLQVGSGGTTGTLTLITTTSPPAWRSSPRATC